MSSTAERRMMRKMKKDIKKGILKKGVGKERELNLPTVNEMEDYIKAKIEEFNKPTEKKEDMNNNLSEYELIED